MTLQAKYKIIQIVARGGTAILYKAIQTSLDRTVAIKKLHQHLTDDENFTRRFILEAKAAASLDHENIVRVIDFGREDGEYQIIMEFIEGKSLKEILRERGRLPQEIAIAITHQICLGLEHAHSKGIIHRDIKPGNVLITKFGRVKITDFGLAKLTQGASYQTVAESILGTPLYMSPEQAYGETVDSRSDIFSLGTVLYEMLTGKQPFFSDSCAAIINNIIRCNVDPPSFFNENIPEELDELVLTALSKSRETRFQSAGELRRALERYLGIQLLKEASEKLASLISSSSDTLILSDTPSPSSHMRRKRRIRAAISSGLIAVLAGGIAFHYDMISDFFKTGTTNIKVADRNVQTMESGQMPGFEGISPPDGAVLKNDTSMVPDTSSFAISGDEDSSLIHGDAPPESTISASAMEEKGENRSPGSTSGDSTMTKESKVERKPAVRKGWLSVSADPLAEIYIDGRYVGDTPTYSPIALSGGLHTLECRNPQYETYTEELTITPGELSRRNIKLIKLKGTIRIFTQPGAEFYLDGIFKGITPLKNGLEVEVGKHFLTLKKAGFNTWSSEVKIEANQSLPLRITLSPSFQR